MSHPRLRRALGLFLAVLLCLPAGALAADEAPAPGNGTLRGKILLKDGKSPAAGVTVRAIHLDTNEVFESAPTGNDGKYAIDGLPYGYYEVVVETADGLYLSNQALAVPPEDKVTAIFLLTGIRPGEREYWEADPTRVVPGTDQRPFGVARLDEEGWKESFWKTGRGIAVLVGGGAVAVGLLIGLSDDDPKRDDESRASPSAP